MSVYKCSACNFTSDYKCNVIKHISKQKKCSAEKLKIILIESTIECSICSNIFSDKNSLNRHFKKCKIQYEDNKKIKELENKVTELSSKLLSTNINTTNNTTNNTMTNTNTINNYITINLTPYNDPNMEGMQQYLEAAVRKTFLSVPNLIESVHFNDEYPENQNICITNRRTNDAKVFDGKKWKTINKELLLNEIVDTYERELTNYAEENGKIRYIKDYESAKKRGNAEKDLKDEVHNIIYDNSEMVNTKIKEVQKPIKRHDTQEILNVVDSQIDSKTSSETSSEPPPFDEYEEFRKKLESESE